MNRKVAREYTSDQTLLRKIHRSTTISLAAITIIAHVSAVYAQVPMTEIVRSTERSDVRLINDLRRFIPEKMREYGTPGANLALARHRIVIWEAGFGYSDLTSKALMTPQSVFHAGSISKTYTATAVMQLVEGAVPQGDASSALTSPIK
jgi:CubicO group peptidase (beta-lactamase class C family)